MRRAMNHCKITSGHENVRKTIRRFPQIYISTFRCSEGGPRRVLQVGFPNVGFVLPSNKVLHSLFLNLIVVRAFGGSRHRVFQRVLETYLGGFRDVSRESPRRVPMDISDKFSGMLAISFREMIVKATEVFALKFHEGV